MRIAGIVLCGGKSSRMGRPKAWLPFGHALMLQRVVRVLGEVVSPVVVVAAPGQDVPPLPESVAVVRDEVEGRGPLAGFAAGLAALKDTADAAYLSACDVPFLTPAFVARVVDCLSPPSPLEEEGGRRPGDLSSPSPRGEGGRRPGDLSSLSPRGEGGRRPGEGEALPPRQ